MKYIEFRLKKTLGKTSIWYCVNIHQEYAIGVVKWYPRWRQYCYFPFTETVYSAGCLEDIQTFISEKMEEHKIAAIGKEEGE